MEKITVEKLREIIESHGRWLRDGGGGTEADLSRANLSGANLFGAYLSGANLSGANLSGANLSRANLSRANLFGADLSGADLSGANLSGANLSGADLFRANLSGADLSGANLFGAYLSGANLSGALNMDTFYQIGPIGSRMGYTVYNVTKDQIQCGCWSSNLSDFEARVRAVYGETNEKYLQEYLGAIEFFKGRK